ncbi:MAG: hypothetical protein LBN39_00500 [Planctomycetaceae bacterium]|jgi:hypothetical protein|nr:hypothetical protein [Planctomycetaceae bacterium]
MSNTETTSLFSATWNDASESDASYTRFSILALLAALSGVASFLVFMTPWFFFLGVTGVLLSFGAVFAIVRSDGTLTGIRTAQFGLCASLISLFGVAVLWPVYQYGVQREADWFFRIWFEELGKDNLPLAKGLTSMYWERPATQDPEKWWKDQYENKFAHKSIHTYTDNKLVRIIAALGEKAEVSYYKTLSVTTTDEKDIVANVYAVSYPNKEGKTETFFVKMTGRRAFPSGDVRSAGWALDGEPQFYLPDEFKAEAKPSANGAATETPAKEH